MSTLFKAILLFLAFIVSFGSQANSYLLERVTEDTPTVTTPTSFATVNGEIGLKSEQLTGGNLSVSTNNYSQSMSLIDGNFSLPVAADEPFWISASLELQDMPSVIVSIGNYPALTQDSTSVLDLIRASGQVLAKVNVIGGEAKSMSVVGIATSYNGSISESYTSNNNMSFPVGETPQVLLALPANMTASIGGTVNIKNNLGCTSTEKLSYKLITLTDLAASGTSTPDIVEWTVDASDLKCDEVALSGNFYLNGLDTQYFNKHQLTLYGKTNISTTLNLGSYRIDSIIEGIYTIIQSSSFSNPYTSLDLPIDSVTVSGDTIYNSIQSVGTSQGSIELSGSWNLADVNSAEINATGYTNETTPRLMSAKDYIDITNGEFYFSRW